MGGQNEEVSVEYGVSVPVEQFSKRRRVYNHLLSMQYCDRCIFHP